MAMLFGIIVPFAVIGFAAWLSHSDHKAWRLADKRAEDLLKRREMYVRKKKPTAKPSRS